MALGPMSGPFNWSRMPTRDAGGCLHISSRQPCGRQQWRGKDSIPEALPEKPDWVDAPNLAARQLTAGHPSKVGRVQYQESPLSDVLAGTGAPEGFA